ncbi:MAG: cystathionine gamma-synthase [Gammaproteobacteria bacterium]|nr:cystathionine gamma-synthase [Gammaproteobacteria bacterium]
MSACRPRNPATVAVRAGIDRDAAFGAVTPPLVLSSNFSFAGFNGKRQYDYTRSGNPTRDLLGEALAELEGGAGGVVTATGMAAIALVLNALLEPGDRLVVPHDGYGGSWRLFNALAAKGAFELVTADLTDPRALADALSQPSTLVWIETPSNPLLRITDLRLVIDAAHQAGALAVVDNTFLSPALQTPLAFGADLVVHSTTKYINGHSDVVGGAVVARDAALHEHLTWWANALGVTGSPFDSFLTLRGLRTLDARLRVHQDNAVALAEWLDAQPAVTRVHYPGLVAHPGHALAARQQRGFGAMLSIELDSGMHADPEVAVRAFVEGLRCFTLAESLGGVESLIAHPATGISPALLRLSVGIEHIDDLIADLRGALARVAVAVGGRCRHGVEA